MPQTAFKLFRIHSPQTGEATDALRRGHPKTETVTCHFQRRMVCTLAGGAEAERTAQPCRVACSGLPPHRFWGESKAGKPGPCAKCEELRPRSVEVHCERAGFLGVSRGPGMTNGRVGPLLRVELEMMLSPFPEPESRETTTRYLYSQWGKGRL